MLDVGAQGNRLVEAALDEAPVAGLTHNFYRYPARFSPALPRTAIELFTEPGDLVLDPFVGGGTTLVEALALGRNGIGTDISSLAAFVTEVKTRIYTRPELDALKTWAALAHQAIDAKAPASGYADYQAAGYLRHLDNKDRWRLKKGIAQAIASTERLPTERLKAFARCTVLRTAQWALDGRKSLPSVEELRAALKANASEMIEGSKALRAASREVTGRRAKVVCLNRPADGLEKVTAVRKAGKPRLIFTSPPYPGVHVLYHRWQVDGGKETPAPFWIANRLDGDGAAYYTMGDRKARELQTYFDKLRASLRSVVSVCGTDTLLVQVVAFSSPDWQLPRYLAVADDVGLEECFLPQLTGIVDGRLWRSVPNRKWYANRRGKTSSSQEVVLFHRLKPR
jgi:hypothetical protein